MKKFDENKFSNDLKLLRGNDTQSDFAIKLNTNRTTISFLERNAQLPSLEILTRFCNLINKNIDDYFIDDKETSLLYFMGDLTDDDKKEVNNVISKIHIIEKYKILGRLSNEK